MPRVSDPVEDARKFCEEFQEQYGREGPNFVPLDWQDATQQAHAQLKLIFIYLHSPHHEASFVQPPRPILRVYTIMPPH